MKKWYTMLNIYLEWEGATYSVCEHIRETMLKTWSRVEPELEYQIESVKSLLWILVPLIQAPLHPHVLDF